MLIMKTSIVTTDNFRREAKKLIKKYHSLKNELIDFSNALESDPKQGVLITENTYKIRLAVKSKGKGKSGGLRIITYVYLKINEYETEVYLLSIYDKSDYENISDKLLKQLIEDIEEDINTENEDQ